MSGAPRSEEERQCDACGAELGDDPGEPVGMNWVCPDCCAQAKEAVGL